MTMAPCISVCVCTFKRPDLLRVLLDSLENQRAHGFVYEIVVVDNDAGRSAEAVVTRFACRSRLEVTYCVEPRANIARARNLSVLTATGKFIAFIDDDERPTTEWLYQLWQTLHEHDADGVLGPVVPEYDAEPPAWISKGRFFDRPRHETGFHVPWPEARTGNVLVRRAAVETLGPPPFLLQFDSGGEDVDFFRRLSAAGSRLVWSDEAVVYERVPLHRCTRGFLLRRALLRGSNFPKQSGHRLRHVCKSVVAVPCYTAALPLLALAGEHHFISYLVKLADHASRLLSLAGVRLATQREN